MLDREPRAFDVHVEEEIEILLGSLEDCSATHHTRVRDEDVDWGGECAHRALDFFTLRDIRADVLNALDGFSREAQVEGSDAAAAPVQRFRERRPDTAAAAGDEDVLVLEVHAPIVSPKLPVDVLSVTDGDDAHDEHTFLNFIDNAIWPHSYGVEASVFPLQFLSLPGIISKALQSGEHARLFASWQLSKLPFCSLSENDGEHGCDETTYFPPVLPE